MTEKQEHASKALRRAWREFLDKVNKMGNVRLNESTEEGTRSMGNPWFDFHAHVEIDE